MSHASIDRLLQELGPKFPGLPKTAKCLKQYKAVKVSSINDGDYVHFHSWMEDITEYLVNIGVDTSSTVHLCLNIDGIPLFNNSRFYNAYPILVRIQQQPQKIFVAGIFCTNQSCSSLPPPEQFLKDFIKDIQTSDYHFSNGQVKYKFELLIITADAIMRQYLKQIVSHAANNSCERCCQVASRHGGHPTLLKLDILHC